MNTSTALHLISLLDLTSLNATDTPEMIENLCKRAADPMNNTLELPSKNKVAAVCVYPVLIGSAKKALEQLHCSDIHIASVAGGFPSGMFPLSTRLQEIEYAVREGANEIDTVINRSLVRQRLDDEVVREISSMKEASGDAHLKVILETGELQSKEEVYKASRLAIKGGADFIKTSTGKITPAATLDTFEVMMQAISDEFNESGTIIGCKPAGGIRTAVEANAYLESARSILTKNISSDFADDYLCADTFRIGASSLLDDLLEVIRKNEFHP